MNDSSIQTRRRPSSFNLLLFSTSILIGLVGVLWVVPAIRPYKFQGSPVNPPFQANDFTLTDQNGKPFQLNEQRGKVVLLFFGYTHCPDICPMTLNNFTQVKQALGTKADRVDFVFITVDPARDTQQVIKSYLNHFDPSFYGLSGTEEQLSPVWKAYGVYQLPAGAEDINHSDQVYTIDPSGKVRLIYSYGITPQAMAEDLRQLLAVK